MTASLASAVIDALDDDDLARLAERLARHLQSSAGATTAPAEDRWLTTAEAARYIGRTANALHKLTAARLIPFSQDGPGARCYFRPRDLDTWMASR